MVGANSQVVPVVVIDDRRFEREAIARSLAQCGLDTQGISSEEIDGLGVGEGVVLLSLGTAGRGPHVQTVVRLGWRVAVYGQWDETGVAMAVADGALSFVSGTSTIEEVAATCRDLVQGRGGFESGERARLAAHARRVRRAESDYFGGVATLTAREREVLDGLVDGRPPAQIAADSYVSVTTVRNQVQAILTKLNVHSQLEAVAAVRQYGWISDTERNRNDVSAS